MSLTEKLAIIMIILESISLGMEIGDRIERSKNKGKSPEYEGRHRKEDGK